MQRCGAHNCTAEIVNSIRRQTVVNGEERRQEEKESFRQVQALIQRCKSLRPWTLLKTVCPNWRQIPLAWNTQVKKKWRCLPQSAWAVWKGNIALLCLASYVIISHSDISAELSSFLFFNCGAALVIFMFDNVPCSVSRVWSKSLQRSHKVFFSVRTAPRQGASQRFKTESVRGIGFYDNNIIISCPYWYRQYQ